MSEGALRAGLIGYGLAGSTFHAPLIAATPGLELSAVVTANPERAARVSGDHPRARVEASADALWERSDELDLVVVASPTDSHFALAAAAIDRDLAVVVDKPLATGSSQARELIERAERAAVPLTVFHNRRWDSDQMTLRHLLAKGALGTVRRYESRFERWRPELRPGNWRETNVAGEGGGIVLDLMSHLVDQALVLFGAPSNVNGEADRRRLGPAADDAFLALEHAGGVRSHLWASAVSPLPGPRLRVVGSEAGFVVDALDGQEQALLAGHRPDDPGRAWGEEAREHWGRLSRGGEAAPVPSLPGAWPLFYEQVVAAIRDGAPVPVDPRDALAGLEVLERAGLIEAER